MTKLFWLIPAILFLTQLFFTLNSQTQIRYEELADSVRNVFWLEKGLVYDGVSGSVGWYATLLSVYKVFGFELHSAKNVRLVLVFVSMVCLGLILNKYKVRHFYLPFLVIGLSPSFLYFNTLQTPHGIDLIFVPICIFLVTHTRRVVQILGWGLVMWAWLSYPSFIFYLPGLLMIYHWKIKTQPKQLLLSLIGFLTPLFAILLFVKNRSLLIFDPNLNSGLFRGAGSFDISSDNFSQNLGGFVKDLFLGGSSYHFEVEKGEFSLIFPIISVVAVFVISYLLIFKYKKWVKINLLTLSLMITALIFSSLISDPSGSPGMRRYSPFLVYFYTLFIFAWQVTLTQKFKSEIWKKITVGTLYLLFIHHLVVYPINLSHISDPSPNQYPIWFNTETTPEKSLNSLVEKTKQEDLKLICLDEDGKPVYCRYAEVYASVAGSCIWNKLDCKNILGYDFNTDQFIPLSVDLWNDYYFEH